MHSRATSANSANLGQPKPYVIVGAGRLSAAVWKTMSADGEADYQFNVFSLDATDGSVCQCFSAHDVGDLAKLAHVLAAVLVDEGCVDSGVRKRLRSLINDLETIFCSDSH
jgi:hypothetical protein